MIETRIVKIVMVGSLALFAGLVTFDNLTDYETNYTFVRIKIRSGAVILGTAIVLSLALASCSAKDCAYYGSPDANTRCVVISAPTTGGGQ